MDASAAEDRRPKYTTSHRVQAWFLGRSRNRWKQKCRDLKVQTKRLQNRVADVTKSREKQRRETQQLQRRLQEVEAQNAALQQQAAALKKDGPDGRP
jgi:hypothetical protein